MNSAHPSQQADRDSEDLSNGYLPQVALLHPEPTLVGVWDLDREDGVRWFAASERSATSETTARDQQLLVRLHQEPLAIVHIDEPPSREPTTGEPTAGEPTAGMLATVWNQAGGKIHSHIERHRCVAAPTAPEDLAGAHDCSSAQPQRPPGHAAVIVCTVRPDALPRCLESLARMDCDDFEVVVVDNRPSVPGIAEITQRYASQLDLKYVAEPRPGKSFASNAGVAAAPEARYLAFVDDDVVVDEHWLAWLLAPFCDGAVQATTGLVMPLSLGDPVQKRFELYAGFGKGVERVRYDLRAHRPEGKLLYPYFGDVFGSGNSMAFTREVLDAIGGFDVALGPGTPTASGEDIAALTDVVLTGGEIVYEPRSACWHEHRADDAALRVQVHNYGIGLTAVFWRYLWRDIGFTVTVIRSVPVTLRLLARRRRQQGEQVLPAELVRLESRARWLGPWRYTVARRRTKATAVPGRR